CARIEGDGNYGYAMDYW
nr:immunoglobulin heavy chain junction region [Mus musculus]